MEEKKFYSKEELESIKQVPIEAALARLGLRTEHTHTGLYYSPWNQNEKEPSLHVSRAANTWALFSNNYPSMLDATKGSRKRVGGNVVDLVLAVQFNSFEPRNIPEAARFLAPMAGEVYSFQQATVKVGKYESEGNKELIVRKLENLHSRTLLNYVVNKRKIFPEIAKSILYEANYDIVYESGKTLNFFAVAWPNMGVSRIFGEQGKGIERALSLRYEKDGDKPVNIKMSTGADITLIDKDGKHRIDDITPSSDKLLIFEGFMDYASWLCWKNADNFIQGKPLEQRTPLDRDIIVLNSTQNTSIVLPFISNYPQVGLYLDTDTTGRHTAAELIERRLEDCLEMNMVRFKREIIDSHRNDTGFDRGAFQFSDAEKDRIESMKRKLESELLGFSREELDRMKETVKSEIKALDGEERKRYIYNLQMGDNFQKMGMNGIIPFLDTFTSDNMWKDSIRHNIRNIVHDIIYDRACNNADFCRKFGIFVPTHRVIGEYNDLNEVWKHKYDDLCVKKIKLEAYRREQEQSRNEEALQQNARQSKGHGIR